MINIDNPIGKVTHFYDKINVAVLDLESGSLKVGDTIKFKQGDNEFTQSVDSLQVDHQQVESVKSGDSFGLKVDKPTKPGTLVYSS